ncbi:rho GTPase-activating protein 19 [Xenopus laevis]|uniref:Rho GTPase-activating protein 19 n=1 Tax=Xenopus laevis TaxID=8355 RepID=RHG19_XENLA|nr:rho GTPase-activating protein 19 [Xenopus laevis]Q6INE5.1 RecName: Full=Rho GTPase-activating protein 19; AltName: Full=Rho-type GTPase-activating protein 19 [Xenopus laevis]AAH72338.1 MGC83212 protein [Xenopus laevis]
MAATEDGGEVDRGISGDALCRIVICNDASLRSQPVIYNPDFFVEKLRHENPEVFTELVVSNLTRLIDLPGTELAQLMGEVDPKLPGHNGAASSFFRSLNFLKRKEKGIVFGAPLTEEGIAQIYQLIDYLHKNLRTEGLFRIPGNSIRQQNLKDLLNSGMDIDVESGEFHPNDVATLLKMFLGELPEPLLTHRHYIAHLKIANLMLFDAKGNRTGVPDKERQIEALQLLFLLLPSPNRNLLKLLLDLLYQTARKQDRNKMSAHNLALMFAPHIIWPKNLTANDLQEHLIKLNNGVTFMIKHSQKLFKAPPYIREYARLHFSGSRTPASKDDLDLLPTRSPSEFHFLKHSKRSRLGSSPSSSTSLQEQTQQHTEEALKELFRHVHNMPDSAKKKRLIRQFNKNTPRTPVSDTQVPNGKKHVRSRTFSGMIKRKVLGSQMASEKKSRTITPQSADGSEYAKENLKYVSVDSPAVYFTRAKLKLSEDLQIRKEASSKSKKSHHKSTQETSI